MADQKPKKKNSGDRNTYRHNGKAWKRRVCGARHEPVNCSRCTEIYTARHNAGVPKARAKHEAAKLAAAGS